MYFAPDPHTGYRLQPNSTGRFGPFAATVNRHGHRDDAVDLKKPQGVLQDPGPWRLLYRRGYGGQEEAYPQRLEVLLNPGGEHRIEVVNAGVGGWDPFQYAQYYEHTGRRFSPDLVVVGFFVGNDAYSPVSDVSTLPTAVMGRRVQRQTAGDPLLKVKIFCYEHFHTARLFFNRGRGNALQDFEAFKRKSCSDFSNDYLIIQSARLQNHLPANVRLRSLARRNIAQIARIQRLAAADGASLVVVLIPDENQINRALQEALVPPGASHRYDFDMPQPMLARMLAAENIPVVDLLPLFRSDPRCLYMNDTHWTVEDHELAARAIRDRIAGGIKDR